MRCAKNLSTPRTNQLAHFRRVDVLAVVEDVLGKQFNVRVLIELLQVDAAPPDAQHRM